MPDYKLAVIAGDGVGPEVIAEGRKVLDAVSRSNPGLSFTSTEFPWGSAYYRETGSLMPDDGIDQLAGHDAILFGAVGDPNIPDHITLQGSAAAHAAQFSTRGCASAPAYLLPWRGLAPVGQESRSQIDLVIFRENTEGEYAPGGRAAVPGNAPTRRLCRPTSSPGGAPSG